ncbi:MAG: site-specific DNA-methyltransferase [Deltaproteobacteria bacterium]|nr:site-specific DNA-methyltransferase [Deltaproteobacteria bacterium]
MLRENATIWPAPRWVYQADAREWLRTRIAADGTSVVTSLPDVSEVPPHRLDDWREWFMATAAQVMRWVPIGCQSIFFQSDIRHHHVWIDKSYLLQRAAEQVEAKLVWHKIVCRRPPGTIAAGRPSYAHMLCFARGDVITPERPGADVLADGGAMSWSRAMGARACMVACRYLRDETPTRVVVDPFCGEGAVLAAANQLGLAAVGVDLSPKRCKTALRQV